MNSFIFILSTVAIVKAASPAECVDQCGSSDLTCLSKCLGLPNPSDDQANATTDCNSQCSSSNSNPDSCFTNCIKSFFSNNDLNSASLARPTSIAQETSSKASRSTNQASSSVDNSSSSGAASKSKSQSYSQLKSTSSASKGTNQINNVSGSETNCISFVTPMTLALAALSMI